MLVVPFCVVLAWMMGQPLDLNFNEFEALVLFISVLLAAVVVQVGTQPTLANMGQHHEMKLLTQTCTLPIQAGAYRAYANSLMYLPAAVVKIRCRTGPVTG